VHFKCIGIGLTKSSAFFYFRGSFNEPASMSLLAKYLALAPNLLRPSRLALVLRDALKIKNTLPLATQSSLALTIEWLLQSHRHAPSGGSSAGYSILEGWLPSYPETTGYIIPTLWHYAEGVSDAAKKEELQKAALAMTDWEIEIQLENGAVRGGWYGTDKLGRFSKNDLPVAFNTGMVLLGFAESYAQTKRDAYLRAGIRAGDWLAENQEPSGAWLKGASEATRNSGYSYYTMIAFGLAAFAKASGLEKYHHVATKHVDWVVSQQAQNGFYKFMSFTEGVAPYLHTIAYTIQGVLEVGLFLEREDYIRSAEKAAFELLKRFEISGNLWGEYDEKWKPVRKYWCVTGIAQMSIVWSKLYLKSGDARYFNAALKANDAIKSIQPVKTNAGFKGAVRGSYPVWERYSRFYFPNWAAKFYADALMLELTAQEHFEAQVSRATEPASIETTTKEPLTKPAI
jgi:hypothetical protein